jgi:hypothetical protein
MDINSPQFKEKVIQIVKDLQKSGNFTDRKLTDTPTDALSIVNRRFVTLNGITSSRPRSSILGQAYFDTTLGKPVWWDGSKFVDATGSAA